MRRAPLILVITLALVACGDDGSADPPTSTTTTQPTTPESTTTESTPAESTTTESTATTSGSLPPALESGMIAFSGQGNDLVAYMADGSRRVVIPRASEDDPDSRDINGQICFLDERTFVAGEDTGQPEIVPGWGVFTLEGETFDELRGVQIAKLVPTYRPAGSQPEMFGCGVLSGGRVVLTDIGNQASGPPTGQLLMFFPTDGGYEGEVTDHCKLDVEIATAQQIAVVGDDVLVAAARGPGVSRYSGLPITIDECGGGPDPAVYDGVAEELVIDPTEGNLGITNGITASPTGGWYVSSVFTGVINEYDADGAFVREILRPPEGETLGAEPFSTGTPNGLGVTADGTLWYADLGIVVRESGSIGPGSGTGTVRIIRFVDGEPQMPEIIDEGLAFPDAIGILP